MDFLASLDWGSLAGGVIGAVAAFLAAWTVYSKQRNSDRLRLRMKTFLELQRTIEQGIDKVQKTQNSPFQDMFDALMGYLIEPIQDLMPSAAEAGADLYGHVFKSIFAVRSKITERVPTHYWSDKDALQSNVTLANEIREYANTAFVHLLRDIERLREDHPWHKRMRKTVSNGRES